MVTAVTVSEQVKQAEIEMATFVVEHTLPFAVMDHLSDLVKEIFLTLILLASSKASILKLRLSLKKL